MILSVLTKQHIEEKLGKKLRYTSDYDALSYDIERITRQRISTNTLKRLLGCIQSVQEPRLFTLDVIAQYLGYENWDVYILSLGKDDSSGFNQLEADGECCQEIVAESLSQGDKVEFQYYHNHKVVLEYTENRTFLVADSTNCKLQTDDIVEIKNFFLNYPLFVNDIVRNGVNVGKSTIANISGLTYLRVIRQDK